MLENQIVAISGGAGRLGSAFSKAVVENGGKVIIGDINSGVGNRLVSDLGDDVALFFEGNLTEPNTVDLMIRKGVEKFGKIGNISLKLVLMVKTFTNALKQIILKLFC